MRVSEKTNTRERHRTLRSVGAVGLLIGALVVVGSCQMPGASGSGGGGSLVITIGKASSLTLVPPIDMTIASYDISGAGPNNSTFSQSTSGASTSVTITNLVFGSWSVTVSAKNAGGSIIGQGTGSVNVDTGKQSSLSITVAPLSGNGTISLNVTWTAANVQSPSISAQLQPSSGSAIPLTFTIGSGTASCLNTSIPAGYYTLSVQLLDNGTLVQGAGASDVVRIVAGQITSGSIDFTQASAGTGSILITITPTVTDPIPVTMSGQQAMLSKGTSTTVTASIPQGVGPVTYTWFLNGAQTGTGSSLTFNTSGAPLNTGLNRLDVAVVTSDGSRGGSATSTFNVVNRFYTTSFPLTENPISESGNWINGGTVGLDWNNVLTTPGLAQGQDPNSAQYDDPTALLTGTWGPDQAVQATVHSVNQNANYYQEVEIRLRSQISAHTLTGYEILFRCLKTADAYMQIVRWNGALGDFTYLSSYSGVQYGVTDGDVVKATIVGNTIKVYINGVQMGSATDGTFATGNPGMGFNFDQGTTYGDFGFSSLTAYY